MLLVGARLAATAIAAALLTQHGVKGYEVAGLVYGAASAAAVARVAALRRNPAAWVADFAVASALVVFSPDWRSAFYVLWLTTLALPAAMLPRRAAAGLAIAAPAVFLGMAIAGGPIPGTLGSVSAETLAIHLSLPLLLVAAIAYSTDVLVLLQDERVERERLAIAAERRRIAWELHDSAKQRLHAAHLLVSSLDGRVGGQLGVTVRRAMVELESASSDMDTSLAELRSPLEGRPLHRAFSARVAEMRSDGGPDIAVIGEAPPLAPLVAAHAYRIGCEALTNALRHADANDIELAMASDGSDFVLTVRDDGRGLGDAATRAGATGLLAMQSRAETIGGRLAVEPPGDGRGTQITLTLPLTATGGPP